MTNEHMKVFDRLRVVVLSYAVIGLLLALTDAFVVQPSLFQLWLDSWAMKIGMFLVLWFLAPPLWRWLKKRGLKESE